VNAFEQLASTLSRLQAPAVRPSQAGSRAPAASRTARIRQIVADRGPINAQSIALELDEDNVDSGRIAALLANDIRKGRIERVASGYRLVDDFDEQMQAELADAMKLLRRHGYMIIRRSDA
jgi:hypothetical protein